MAPQVGLEPTTPVFLSVNIVFSVRCADKHSQHTALTVFSQNKRIPYLYIFSFDHIFLPFARYPSSFHTG